MKPSSTSTEAVRDQRVASGHGRTTATVRGSHRKETRRVPREGRVHVGMVCVCARA